MIIFRGCFIKKLRPVGNLYDIYDKIIKKEIMLVVFSALALGACDKCEDSSVDIGLLSYETIQADYQVLNTDTSCNMENRRILFKLAHLTDGTLGFTYSYDCWEQDTGFVGGNDKNLPFASSCEDPMWTREGGLDISSDAYKSDRHCFEPLLDSEIPKTCPACDDTGVDIGYLNFEDLKLEMDLLTNGCGDDKKKYLLLALTKDAENKYAFTNTISCWTSDGSSETSSFSDPIFTANECEDATAWLNNEKEEISEETYKTNRYCLQHHVEVAKKKVAAKAEDESSGLSGGEIAGIVIGSVIVVSALVLGATGRISCRMGGKMELLQDYM